VKHRNQILLHGSVAATWDRNKLERWIDFYGKIKRIAQKKGDKDIVGVCNKGLKIARSLRKEAKTSNKNEFQNVTDKIRGLPACKGKVRGKVKIILSPMEIANLNKGDILVAPMTTPAYLIGIEKAVAIVTDKGGTLCHAAVISREFNIPCVVGTGVATKFLQDGDQVEVDANKGVIKKI